MESLDDQARKHDEILHAVAMISAVDALQEQSQLEAKLPMQIVEESRVRLNNAIELYEMAAKMSLMQGWYAYSRKHESLSESDNISSDSDKILPNLINVLKTPEYTLVIYQDMTRTDQNKLACVIKSSQEHIFSEHSTTTGRDGNMIIDQVLDELRLVMQFGIIPDKRFREDWAMRYKRKDEEKMSKYLKKVKDILPTCGSPEFHDMFIKRL